MTAGLPSKRKKMDLFFNFIGFLKSGVSSDFFSVFLLKPTFFIALIFFISVLSFGSPKIFANNVSVSSVEIVDEDSSAKTAKIQFNLSWENSWRDSVNHDAAWVFFKYSTDSGVTWNHATMKTSGTNPSGFSSGTRSSGAFNSLDLVVPADKKGLFVEPAHLGDGALNFTGIKAVWDYGADGVSDPYSAWSIINGSTQIKAVAIEMVYIPEEGFYLGDGNVGSQGQFEFGGASGNRPGSVGNEETMSFGTGTTQWYYNTDSQASDDASGSSFEVAEAFPKGFKAFYLMKYEITEGQYVDFLNSLLRPMQNLRVNADVSGDSPAGGAVYVMLNSSSLTFRNTIQCPASGNGTTNPIVFSTDRPNRAASYLRWMDLTAYADWSGLRPMTELEFEKAARGPIYPITSEYAWGSSTGNACSNFSGAEDGTETCNDGAGYQANFGSTSWGGGDGGQGPVRAGLFATTSTTTRVDSGAGYYGNMELSGNNWEMVVTIGNATGRGFSGTHGDGYLVDFAVTGYAGNATNIDWPGIDPTNSYGITSGAGTGWRGGGAFYVGSYAQISDRSFGGHATASTQNDLGGRCARTAPDNS